MELVSRPNVLEIMAALHRGPRRLDQIVETAGIEVGGSFEKALVLLVKEGFVAATGDRDGDEQVYALAPRGSSLLEQLIALRRDLAHDDGEDSDLPPIEADHTLVE